MHKLRRVQTSQLHPNARVFTLDFFEPHGEIPADKVPPRTDQDKRGFQEWRKKASDRPQNATGFATCAKYLEGVVISPLAPLVSVGVPPF